MPYDVVIFPTMLAGFDTFADGWPGWERGPVDFSMYELIRNLSNVSTHFRKEFEDVFWRRTIIALDEQHKLVPTFVAFTEFLKGRPAVRSKIRKLEHELKLNHIRWDRNSHRRQLQDFCEALASLQNLEVLDMYITIPEDQFPDIESDSPARKFFQAFRKVPVLQDFLLTVGIERPLTHKIPHEVSHEWSSKFRRIMMPNTLRDPKSLDEMER